jgi:hypothetical protein
LKRLSSRCIHSHVYTHDFRITVVAAGFAGGMGWEVGLLLDKGKGFDLATGESQFLHSIPVEHPLLVSRK